MPLHAEWWRAAERGVYSHVIKTPMDHDRPATAVAVPDRRIRSLQSRRTKQTDRQTMPYGWTRCDGSLLLSAAQSRCFVARLSQCSVALSHTHSFLVRLLMDEAVASCSDLSRSRIEVCVCGYVCVYMRPRSGSGRGGSKLGEEWYVLLQCQQRLLHTREKAARRAQPFKARVETQPPQSAFANAAMTRCTAAPRDG